MKNVNATEIAQNLNQYFDYLSSTNKLENKSHFISLCSAEDYPNTLNFISENCSSLYKKMMEALA